VNIPKAGKPLGIPALRNRLLMSAAKLALEPIFEADFSPVSFGFRLKRSAHDALEHRPIADPVLDQGQEYALVDLVEQLLMSA